MSAEETIKKLIAAERSGRSVSREDFLAGIKALMNNPGLSTRKADRSKLEDATAEEIRRRQEEKKLHMEKLDRELEEKQRQADAEAFQRLMRAGGFEDLEPNTEDEMKDEDDDMDQLALEAELADLAQDMTKQYQEARAFGHACTLRGPENLTVFSEGRGFSKLSHIGREEFAPIEAYVGKKGRIIVKFKPLNAAGYERMEMFADDAVEKMEGFESFDDPNDGSFNGRLYETRIRAINQERARLREQKANEDKFETYKDLGFGSF